MNDDFAMNPVGTTLLSQMHLLTDEIRKLREVVQVPGFVWKAPELSAADAARQQELKGMIEKFNNKVQPPQQVTLDPDFRAYPTRPAPPAHLVLQHINGEIESFTYYPTPNPIEPMWVPRAKGWRKASDAFLGLNPNCACCGAREGVVAHHIVPVHVDPSKELDPDNLITLCPRDHLLFGHGLNWRHWNPDVIKDCRKMRKRIKECREHAEEFQRRKSKEPPVR